MNWYPARLVSNQIIADVGWVYSTTGVKRIILVNEPKVVGNGHAIAWDRSYGPVGKLYVSRDLELTAIDMVGPTARLGESFSNSRCIFLSWQNGQPVLRYQLVYEASRLVLDCSTGLAKAINDSNTQNALLYRTESGRERLQAFMGNYAFDAGK